MSTPESLKWDADHDAMDEEKYWDHDSLDHDDPKDFCDECDYCLTKLEEEIDNGIRCSHGEYIPFINPKGDYMTDQECTQCQIDYGPAYESQWIERIGRAKV